MKANELRIGNWVLNQGELIELTKQKFKMAVISFNCQEIKPIPLTEEWLVRFGFTLINRVDYESNCGVLELEATDAGYLFDSRIIINSVHSLQNLYFALTGEELKLNEI